LPGFIGLKTGKGVFTEVVLMNQVFEELGWDRGGDCSFTLRTLTICWNALTANWMPTRDENDWVGE